MAPDGVLHEMTPASFLTILAAASTLALAGAGVGGQPAALPAVVDPFPRGLTGVLVFQSDRAGRDAIYRLDLAAGRVSPLSGSPQWSEGNPRWSPDGTRIVFKSNRAHYEGARPETGTPDFDLWVMNADGSGRRRLTTDPATEEDPGWFPDGRSLVFSSDRDSRGDLYRLWLDSGRTERLTRHFVGRAIMPTVSPDGTRIAFGAQTLRVGQFWDYQVHVLDVASGRSEAVTAEGGSCWPAWSDDGSRMAHVLLRPQRPSRLAIRDVRTGASRTISGSDPMWHYYPDWSPDARQIAYSISPAHHEGEDWDLSLYTIDTGTHVRLTRGPGNDRLPDWRP
jgi:Tol biopolymer transport system component